jgi:hypothetical protein
MSNEFSGGWGRPKDNNNNVLLGGEMTVSRTSRLIALAVLLPLYVAACGGVDSGDDSFGPVSSAHNPPIASLNDVLTAPSSETTTFQPLLSVAEGRFETRFSEPDIDPSSRFVRASVTDEAAPGLQIDIQGGFTGIDNSLGNFTTANSAVSASPDGAYLIFKNAAGELRVLIPGLGASGLDYTSFGVAWSSSLNVGCVFGICGTGDRFDNTTAFAFGLMTPAENVPQSGSAGFSGFMAGAFFDNFGARELNGNADLHVNFGSHNLTGSLNNIVTGFGNAFPDITLSASYGGNQITGTAANAPSGSIPSMSGDFVARFFGPNAEEIGGTVAISGDDAAMSGAFAATRFPRVGIPDTRKLSELTEVGYFGGPVVGSGFDSVGSGSIGANPAAPDYSVSWDPFGDYSQFASSDPELTRFSSISIVRAANLDILTPGASGLDYSSYGIWAQRDEPLSPDPQFSHRAISFGYLTRDMPTLGSASYAGRMDGWFTDGPDTRFRVAGDAALAVNFGDGGAITGAFSNLSDINEPSTTFADVNLNATVSGHQFAGTVTSGSLAENPGALATNMSGPVEGRFYGPAAAETGGVFQMGAADGREFTGAFAAKQ